MAKGEQRSKREKKKPKKDKGTKNVTAYAADYGRGHPHHIADTAPGKKQ